MIKKMVSKKALVFLIVVLILSINGFSQEPTGTTIGNEDLNKMLDGDLFSKALEGGQPGKIEEGPSIVTQSIALALMALAPFILMLLTSYIKTVVVLALLRQAIGAQQTPPNQVINGIAMILTIYVMFPTGLAMYEASEDIINKAPPAALISADSAELLIRVADKAKEPLREFLQRNSSVKHLYSFRQLAHRSFPKSYRESLVKENFIILIPAFITSQLKDAFEIGVLIYLPFFVIDLVVSNILLAMGMMMMSPLTIALPLKLFLLVALDGWTLLSQGLVLTFK